MTIKVWVRPDERISETGCSRYCRFLIEQGIEIQDHDNYLSGHPGVVFSKEITSETCEQLRELSHSGQIPTLFCCDCAISVKYYLAASGSRCLRCLDVYRVQGNHPRNHYPPAALGNNRLHGKFTCRTEYASRRKFGPESNSAPGC